MTSLLDTDVVSQQTKPKPHEAVVRWWSQKQQHDLYLSVVSLAELRFGIESMDSGRKRRNLQEWLTLDLPGQFQERLLSVTPAIADEAGRLVALARRQKIKLELADALIAATAAVHGLQVATLNRKHFERLGIDLVKF